MNTLKFSKVKSYTDIQLLEKVQSLCSFVDIPKNYWILGVQSEEDTVNEFDDKFYLFKGTQFVMVTSGTTNAGLTGLKNYDRYSNLGCAVIKTNEWYYNLWKFGFHNGRMAALKQVNNIKYYRDWNRNIKVEEIGKLYEGKIGINFHTISYTKNMSLWRRFIWGWSSGCQVVNSLQRYYDILDLVEYQEKISYCLIKEF